MLKSTENHSYSHYCGGLGCLRFRGEAFGPSGVEWFKYLSARGPEVSGSVFERGIRGTEVLLDESVSGENGSCQ